MLANNEVGTIQPVTEIGRRVRAHKGVLFHVDAVQAAPYVEIDVEALGVDLLSLAAHKFEGPKGIGALYVRHGTHMLAQQQGGTQERYRRAGTENVPGAVGFATAYELSCAERPETARRLRRQRDRLKTAVLGVDGTELTGHPRERLPGLLSIVVRDADGSAIAMSLDLVHDGLDRGQPCPDRDGLPGGRSPWSPSTLARPHDDRRGGRNGLRRRPTRGRVDARRCACRRRGPARPGRGSLTPASVALVA